MKPTTLFFSLLGAIGVSAVSAIPSFAQITSVPITGGSFSATNTTGVGTTYNSATALTSFGTINFTSVTGGALTIPAIGFTSVGVSNPSRLPVAGDTVNVNNTISSGTISNQSFSSAPLNATGLVQTFSQPAANVYSITGSVTSGTIGLPSSLVSSLSTTPVPITGGSLSLGGSISNSGLVSGIANVTALTSFGIVNFDSFNPSSNVIFRVPAIGFDSSNSLSSVTRDIAVGDSLSLLNLLGNGRISERSFQNAPVNLNGRVDSTSLSSNSGSLTASLNGGSIVLPTTLLNGLPTNTGTSGISSNPSTLRFFGRLTYDASSSIFTVQPVASASENALPIGKSVSFVFVSSLTNSRIHPDLVGR